MNISEILSGNVTSSSVEEQKEVLEQMKEQKVFDLSDAERANLIDFLCDQVESEVAVEYLFHVLDTEISYPIDDEKAKSIFSDERMKKLKDLMMNDLVEDEVSTTDSDDSEVDIEDEN